MENFIYDYFIQPIGDRTGYNIVNTLVYAIIAIIAIYCINRVIKNRIKIDENFIKSTLCFVLFGSTVRVVTDSIDNGVFKPVTPIHQFVLDSHIWDYPPAEPTTIWQVFQFWTASPGIYIATAALFLASLVVLNKLKRVEWLGYVGVVLWLPHFLLLVPFMTYALYVIPILLLAIIPTYLAWRYFGDKIITGIVAGQALDGAATFFVIDIFSKISGIQYFEQHVISSAIGNAWGTYFTFYLIKVAIAVAAGQVIKNEKMDIEDKYYIALILMIMGFAPGIRDLLRMTIGG